MGKMILLLCISFLWNTLLDGGHMTCVRPPRHLASIKGKEGELVTKLHLKQPGFWSTAASVKGTGEDVSQFFTTVLTDGRDLTQWQVRVAKALNTELRVVTVIKLTLHCTVEGRTTPFFSEFVLRPPQKRKAERIRPVLEINVNKDTKVGVVFHALSEDFPDSSRDIFEMVKAGDTNTEASMYFYVTEDGRMALTTSLEDFREETVLLVLRRVVPQGSSEIILVSILVNASLQEAERPAGPPMFQLEHCRLLDCRVYVYQAEVRTNHTGEIANISPGRIHADDPNGDPVNYFIVGGNPTSYSTYFTMDSNSGEISAHGLEQIRNNVEFFLTLQARDIPPSGNFETVALHINVVSSTDKIAPMDVSMMSSKGVGGSPQGRRHGTKGTSREFLNDLEVGRPEWIYDEPSEMEREINTNLRIGKLDMTTPSSAAPTIKVLWAIVLLLLLVSSIGWAGSAWNDVSGSVLEFSCHRKRRRHIAAINKEVICGKRVSLDTAIDLKKAT